MDPTTILAEARSALDAIARRTADLVGSLSDLAAPLPHSPWHTHDDWTVRDATVHLLNYAGLYTEIANGTPSPVRSITREGLAAENDRRIADIGEADPGKLTTLMTEAVEGLLEATAGRPGDQEVTFHCGIPLDLASLVCISLGEQVLHGYEMAIAVGAPWPIDPAHALLVLYGYSPLFGSLVNPVTTRGLTAAIGIELRGGPSFTARFVDGVYSAEAPDSGPVDATISADPAAFLFWGAGRIRQWEAVALGLLSVGGQRPELALSFMDLFVYP